MFGFAKNYSFFLPKLSLLLSDFGNYIAMCIVYCFEKKLYYATYVGTTNFPLKILQFSHPNNQILYLSEPGLKSAAVCREPLLLTSMRAMHYKKAWLVYTCTSPSLPPSCASPMRLQEIQ